MAATGGGERTVAGGGFEATTGVPVCGKGIRCS